MGLLKSIFCGVKWFFGVDNEDSPQSQIAKNKAAVFVSTKPSRMFYDEDGDLAEEFYEEITPQQGGNPWMRRITENLTWQGVIPLDIQRLHPDFPIAICDVS